jgi:hypothetical protein
MSLFELSLPEYCSKKRGPDGLGNGRRRLVAVAEELVFWLIWFCSPGLSEISAVATRAKKHNDRINAVQISDREPGNSIIMENSFVEEQRKDKGKGKLRSLLFGFIA